MQTRDSLALTKSLDSTPLQCNSAYLLAMEIKR